MPEPQKTEKLRIMDPPTTVKEVESFLGKVGYYHKFVKNFSQVAYPLNQLKRKNTEWKWGTEQQHAFETLRDQLCESPILRHPDFSLPFILQADASGYGFGAVLLQKFEDGEHPIVYASRTMEDRETRHEIIEKEALAMAWGIHQFRHYLLGKPFRVRTSHRPLVSLHRLKVGNTRLEKLVLRLQGYQFQIEFRADPEAEKQSPAEKYPVIPLQPKMGNPEGGWDKKKVNQVHLSVCKLQSAFSNFSWNKKLKADDQRYNYRRHSYGVHTATYVPPGFHRHGTKKWSELPFQQKIDPHFGPILLYHTEGILPKETKEAKRVLLTKDFYLFENSLLHRLVDSGAKLCIPAGLRNAVLYQSHRTHKGGHFNLRKEYIKTCPMCPLREAVPVQLCETIGFTRSPATVWDRVYMSVWGEENTVATTGGNVCTLALVDKYSKYLIAIPLPDTKPSTVVGALVNEILTIFGPPGELTCIDSRVLASELMHNAFDALGLGYLILTSGADTNESNEREELSLQPYGSILNSLMKDYPKDWDVFVRHAAFSYNATVNRSVGNTPFHAMFGRDTGIPAYNRRVDQETGKPIPRTEWDEKLRLVRRSVNEELARDRPAILPIGQEKKTPTEIEVGCAVIYFPPPYAGQTDAPPPLGPWRVTAMREKTAYLEPLPTGNVMCKPNCTVPIDRLRLCAEETPNTVHFRALELAE
jgi:hypothetical protein